MNNLQKTILFWAGLVFTAVLTLFLLASINKTMNTATTTNTVSFTGEGRVTAKPDIAVISFAVLTESPTSKAAQDDNSRKSKQISDFLKKQNIEDKDIKTTSYNVYPQYNYPRDGGKPQITGYQVTQAFEVKVRDLDKVSTLLDGLVAAGANQVNNLGFKIDDPEKLKNEARAKAIADAKAKANQLKGQIGIRLGHIVNFSENTTGYYPYPVQYELQAKDAVGGMGGGPSVPAGENEIVINITLTYQIK